MEERKLIPLERRGTFFAVCYGFAVAPALAVLTTVALGLFTSMLFAPIAIEMMLRVYDFAILRDLSVRRRPELEGGWATAVLVNTIVLGPALCLLLLAAVALVALVALLCSPLLFALSACVPVRDDLHFFAEFQYSYLQAIRYATSLMLWTVFPTYEPDFALYIPSTADGVPAMSVLARVLASTEAPPGQDHDDARDAVRAARPWPLGRRRAPSLPSPAAEDGNLLRRTGGPLLVASTGHVVIVNGRRMPNGTAIGDGGDDDRVLDGGRRGGGIGRKAGPWGRGSNTAFGGGGGGGKSSGGLGLHRRHLFFWPCFLLAGLPALVAVTAVSTAFFLSGLFFPYGAEALLRLTRYAWPADVNYIDRPVLTGPWRRVVIANAAVLTPLLLAVTAACTVLVAVCAFVFYPIMLLCALFVPVAVDTDFLPEFHRAYRQALHFLATVLWWTLVPLFDPLGDLSDRQVQARVSERRTPSAEFATPPADVVRRVPVGDPQRFSVGAFYAQVLQAVALGRAVRTKMPHTRRGKYFVPCYLASGAPVMVVLALANLALVLTGLFLPLGARSLIVIAEYGFTGDVNFSARPRLSGVWGAIVLAGAILLSPLLVGLWIVSFVLLGALAVFMFPAMVLFAACVPVADTVDVMREFAYSYKQALRFAQVMIIWILLPPYAPSPVSGRRVAFRKLDPAKQHLYASSQTSYSASQSQPATASYVDEDEEDDDEGDEEERIHGSSVTEDEEEEGVEGDDEGGEDDDDDEEEEEETGEEDEDDEDDEGSGADEEDEEDEDEEEDEGTEEEAERVEVGTDNGDASTTETTSEEEPLTDEVDEDSDESDMESINTASTVAVHRTPPAPPSRGLTIQRRDRGTFAYEDGQAVAVPAGQASSSPTVGRTGTILVLPDGRTVPWTTIDDTVSIASADRSHLSLSSALDYQNVGPMVLLPDGRLIEQSAFGPHAMSSVEQFGSLTASTIDMRDM